MWRAGGRRAFHNLHFEWRRRRLPLSPGAADRWRGGRPRRPRPSLGVGAAATARESCGREQPSRIPASVPPSLSTVCPHPFPQSHKPRAFQQRKPLLVTFPSAKKLSLLKKTGKLQDVWLPSFPPPRNLDWTPHRPAR